MRDLAYDASRATEGSLFFCVRGRRADGHEFAAQALANGAVALVVERPVDVAAPQLVVESSRTAMALAADAFFGEPTHELEVAGVTGTNGKTTTAFLLRSLLDAAGRRPGLVGTVEWIVGDERRAAPHTTPEAIDLQRLFREMLDAGNRSVAIEASSHGSAFQRLDRVRFDALKQRPGLVGTELDLKMFQTCGSATFSESESTINAREGSDDYPSAALPLLPRNRYCQAWDVT